MNERGTGYIINVATVGWVVSRAENGITNTNTNNLRLPKQTVDSAPPSSLQSPSRLPIIRRLCSSELNTLAGATV